MTPTRTIEIVVEGEPIGQPRARHDPRSGRVYTPPVREKIGTMTGGKPIYGPDKLQPWKERIALACYGKHRGAIDQLMHVHIDAYFPRPQRLLKKSSPQGAIPHGEKPDKDNVEKAILDAMVDAGLIAKDQRVCGGGTFKWYVAVGSSPGARIRIEILTDDGQLPLHAKPQ